MNLERVQKYYELIDRELGLESNDDLFGFESEEDDLFGFESDEEKDLFGFKSDEEKDLFGFESDEEDLFGFESEEEEDLFGFEGVKDVFGKVKSGIKKGWKAVINFIKKCLATIKGIFGKNYIKRFINKLKKNLVGLDKSKRMAYVTSSAVRTSTVAVIYFLNNDKVANAISKLSSLANALNEEISVARNKFKPSESKALKDIQALIQPLAEKWMDSEWQKQMEERVANFVGDSKSPIDVLSKVFGTITSKLTAFVENLTAEQCDTIGNSITTLYKTINSNLASQLRVIENFKDVLNETDYRIIMSLTKFQTKTTIGLYRIISSAFDEKYTEPKANKSATTDKKEETAPESIMADIKEMMAANESLNDIIFDMEMDM